MKLKRPRIRTISIARLHSLGNYEHVKVELTADVPEGASAKATLLELAAVVERLKPVRKPYNYDHAVSVLNKTAEALSEAEKYCLDEYREIVRNHAALKELQTAAIETLDQLGGSTKKGGGRKDASDEEVPW